MSPVIGWHTRDGARKIHAVCFAICTSRFEVSMTECMSGMASTPTYRSRSGRKGTIGLLPHLPVDLCYRRFFPCEICVICSHGPCTIFVSIILWTEKDSGKIPVGYTTCKTLELPREVQVGPSSSEWRSR